MLAWPSQARWLFTVMSITSKHMTQSCETWWLLQYRRRMATRTDGQTAQTHCFFYATILKNSVCECRTDISQENCTVNSWMKSDCIDTFSHKQLFVLYILLQEYSISTLKPISTNCIRRIYLSTQTKSWCCVTECAAFQRIWVQMA